MLRHSRYLLALLLLAGCDTDEGPIFDADGGADAGQEPVDVDPPRVVSTLPETGATDVAPDFAIVIRFSEPMDEEAGTVEILRDGQTLTVNRSWNVDSTELFLRADLGSDARIQVVVERDFADLAGNTLEAPHVLELRSGDRVAPFVTSADPSEGSTISARTTQLRVELSEPMDATRGTLTLEGGPGELGSITWTLGGFLVPVRGLAYDTAYRVVLSDFADPAGNALDPSPHLGDGALDFTTGPDVDPPQVVDANPSEGQIEVRERLPVITVVFDEAMDTSITEATLRAAGASVPVEGAWSEGGTRIDFDVAGLFVRETAHSLDLDGFRDAAGNPLDPVPHLGDGVLDFVTGIEASSLFPPFVGFTDPVEGAADVSFRRELITVVFSEAMDTSMTSVEISDGTDTFVAEGTWSLASTRFEIDVSEKLWAARAYTIDFSAFRDLDGVTLDLAHPYLGDGVLEFALVAPTGENCRDVLTFAEATTAGGAYEWVVPPGTATINDGSNTCRGNLSASVDAVIRYTKTTPSASDGGTALRVLMTSHEGADEWLSAAVLANECDPSVVGTGPSRLRCTGSHGPQQLYLDVGPGDYYIWVSRYTGSEFPGADVRIEEVATPPEGESCVNPYTTTTASPIYTAPATADDAHIWEIPEDAVDSVDHAVAHNGPGAMECRTSTYANQTGVDAVVTLPKATDTSTGWLLVQGHGTSYPLVAELRDRCEGTDPEMTSLACQANVTSRDTGRVELLIEGPAGDRHLWLSAQSSYADFLGATVTYKEIEPGPGDTCATAIPLDVGTTNLVTPNRPHRLTIPSCFGYEDDVTWYRFTTTEPFAHVTAGLVEDAVEPKIAAFAPSDGSELRCQTGTTAEPLIMVGPTGTEVCVAIASTEDVTSLSVDAYAYTGNLGQPTHLDIGRPVNPSNGSERTITSDYWMVTTPTTLYMGVGSSGVLVAPLSGGVVADFRELTSAELGNDAVAVGEAVFILDDTASASASVRLRRVVTSDGVWSPTDWDTGSVYPALGLDAITYDGTSLLYVSDGDDSNPTHFFSHSPDTPGPATALGTNAGVRDVVGIAADATYFYVVGRTGTTVDTEGVFRIPRSDLSATPVRIAAADVDQTRASIELDDLAAPTFLYFRTDDGRVHVIGDPAGVNPQHFGPITSLGKAGDEAMTIDRSTGAIYMFESVTNSTGNFVRLD